MIFSTLTPAPIRHAAQYAPLDILLADKEGTITQIIPNIKLSELDQEIMPPNPVLAILLLKGGTCAKRSINPGDKIDYSAFKRPPTVVSAPLVITPTPPR